MIIGSSVRSLGDDNSSDQREREGEGSRERGREGGRGRDSVLMCVCVCDYTDSLSSCAKAQNDALGQ